MPIPRNIRLPLQFQPKNNFDTNFKKLCGSIKLKISRDVMAVTGATTFVLGDNCSKELMDPK
jgi:hypothetical protein